MSMAAGLLLALASTAALSYGFYRQHSVVAKLPALAIRRPIAALILLVRNWRWFAGFALGLAGWALYILALRLAPLSLVQATSAGGVGLLALLVRRGGGTLARRERTGVLISVGGLVALGLSLPLAFRASGAPAAGLALPMSWVVVSVVVAGLAAGPLAGRVRAGAGLGAASGLLYSAGDVATKALVTGLRPAWLLIVILLACHGLAFVALQLAFQRGTALATAEMSTLLTNALPVLAGVLVFNEGMPAGLAGGLRGAGFAGTVLGAALLSARPAPRPDEGAAP